ncbi:hypothetical protein HYQ46_010521 [Verticillium longisporum]|nr:hypothetical protein HYQ46_010521 [Verticillium longisporum]
MRGALEGQDDLASSTQRLLLDDELLPLGNHFAHSSFLFFFFLLSFLRFFLGWSSSEASLPALRSSISAMSAFSSKSRASGSCSLRNL